MKTANRPAKIHWFQYAAPARFYGLAGSIAPWCFGLAALSGLFGLVFALVIAPTDAVQGNVWRIFFIHVPSALMSMLLYVVMAFWAAVGLAFNTRLSLMLARAIAPTGALMTFIALVSGSLWGKPAWGTYWVWDARLTSELILLFLYLGFLSLHAAIEDERRADRAAGILALVGVINVPIIYFSVQWWNTLHQAASISITKAPTIAPSMLLGVPAMMLAFWAYAMAVVLVRTRVLIIEREPASIWLAPTARRP